jgi:hypothetical protein
MLRVEPRQRARLVEITRNLADRIDEARANLVFTHQSGRAA